MTKKRGMRAAGGKAPRKKNCKNKFQLKSLQSTLLTHYFPDTLKLTDFDTIFGISFLEYIDTDGMF